MANGGILVGDPQPIVPGGPCQNEAAWFWYNDGSPNGYWTVGFIGPSADSPAGGIRYLRDFSYWALSDYMWPPKVLDVWSTLKLNSSGYFPGAISVTEMAAALFTYNATDFDGNGQTADNYAVVCGDAQQNPSQCPSGYYWDNDSESCQVIIPILPYPIIPPPPPSCPPGQVWDPTTETCIPQTTQPPPPPPPKCAAGFVWDPYLLECVPNPNPNPPPPGPCPNPLSILPCCPPNLGTEGDELTDGFTCTNTNLYIIACWAQAELQAMQGSGGGPNDECCALVVAQLTLIANSVSAIASAIAPAGGGGQPAIDLTIINTAITDIAADLDFFREALPMSISQLVDAITGPLVNAIGALSGATVPPQPIPPVVQHSVAFVDALLEQMASDGRLTTGDEQIITS